MSIVQRVPGGLLELLSAKTSGYTLSGLLPDVRPTLDMLQMFGLGQPIEHVVSLNAAAAPGAAATQAIPATQWWMLYAASVSIGKTATLTSAGVSLVVLNGFGAAPVYLDRAVDTLPTAASVSLVPLVTFVPSYPMLLPPGSVLLGVVDVLGVDPTVLISLNCRIARLS